MEEGINTLELAHLAAAAIDDRKGSSIRIVDVRGVSPLSDFVVIATGTSEPHLKALQAEVSRRLKEEASETCLRVSGDAQTAWVVLDYFDLVVHLFLAEAREYYDIESLWTKGKEIDHSFEA